MGTDTTISWTGASWNPIRARNKETGKVGWHCVKVSPGCANCYAENQNRWTGTGLHYVEESAEKVDVFLDEEMLRKPLSWKPQRIFPCSMMDLMLAPREHVDRVFGVMARARHQTFQVLTKHPELLEEYLQDAYAGGMYDIAERAFPDIVDQGQVLAGFADELPHVWLGTSTENQRQLDERLPRLLSIPASVRFISAEPLLGPLNLQDAVWPLCRASGEKHERDHDGGMWCEERAVDWVIVGGESGRKARRCMLEWIDSIVLQCQEANAPVFVKQVGAWSEAERPSSPLLSGCFVHATSGGVRLALNDRKGEDPSEWPEALRIREFPA